MIINSKTQKSSVFESLTPMQQAKWIREHYIQKIGNLEQEHLKENLESIIAL